MDTKTCNLCRETKPLSSFDKDGSIASGYRGRCKTCRRVVEAEARAAKRAGTSTKVASIEAARTRHVSEEDRQKSLLSQANRNAIQRLIRIHEEDFKMYIREERVRLGVQPKWIPATKIG